jgi:hypothetical protein
MNRRGLPGGLLVIGCLALLWGVWAQQAQLGSLRAEHQQLLAQLTVRERNPASPGTAQVAPASSPIGPPPLVPTPELLRLRNEVSLLAERRRGLEAVRAENARLQAQLAARGTNGPGSSQSLTGYVFRSQARLVGYNTPEDTVQSLLWAVQNHDVTNLLQALTPELAQKIRGELGESNRPIAEVFRQCTSFPGVGIVGRRYNTNHGTVLLQVEFVPGLSGTEISLRQTNGQWKIEWPF